MTKNPSQSAYQVFEDLLMLVSSFAKLSKTIATNKIQSTAETASNYVNAKVELPDLSAKFTEAKESFDNISDYAVHTDLKHMIDDAARFARKHPVTALISVVTVGALVSRLMRAEAVTTKTKPAPTAKPKSKAKPKKSSKTSAVTPKQRRKSNGSVQPNA